MSSNCNLVGVRRCQIARGWIPTLRVFVALGVEVECMEAVDIAARNGATAKALESMARKGLLRERIIRRAPPELPAMAIAYQATEFGRQWLIALDARDAEAGT